MPSYVSEKVADRLFDIGGPIKTPGKVKISGLEATFFRGPYKSGQEIDAKTYAKEYEKLRANDRSASHYLINDLTDDAESGNADARARQSILRDQSSVFDGDFRDFTDAFGERVLLGGARLAMDTATAGLSPVSYTHLTLPTKA